MKRLYFLFLAFILLSCNEPSATSKPNDPGKDPNNQKITNVNVSLGVPKDSDSSDDYLIIRNQYVISYNRNRNEANWVSWNLDKDWYGDVPRYSGKFIKDTSLPGNMYEVTHDDYTNSGYDRGHMVRSEERTKTEEDNRSTFLLTNIIPQSPDLNQGVWLNLEYYCEDLCKKEDKELYVIAGGIYHNGYKTIGHDVAVPDSCFKIIVVLDRGQGLNDIKPDTKVIAVVMPNIQGVRKDSWDKYITTVDRIESSTGYNFLDQLPDAIENELESQPCLTIVNREKEIGKHKQIR